MQKDTGPTPPPPPPPPPTSQPTQPSKINRKTMIAILVIAVIVVAVIVGVYLATRGGGGTGGNVAGASSLQFSEDITIGGNITTYTYSAKNIGTSNAMLRIEWTGLQGDTIYIVNGAQQKVWIYTDGTWNDFSAYYGAYWSQWNTTFTGLTNSLSHWTGSGDYTYTDPATGNGVRIYNIAVNPSLADTLFEHS